MKSKNLQISGLLTLMAALLTGTGLFAQEDPDFPTIAPPTPTAASLHSYGNNSVNYYSGTVDVSIPLYTIQEGNITVPIVLNYTGGNGIKVEEQASWVGLGWALNAGGAVSRAKRGVADEAINGRGFLSYTQIPSETVDGNGNPTNAQFITDIANGIQDGELDKFMYSTPSGSGSFFLDYTQTGEVHQKPFTDKRITYQAVVLPYDDGSVQDCTNTNGLDGFYIHDEQGLKYHFEEKERSNSRNVGGNYYLSQCYPTTWQMTKIEDNNSTLSVDFEYDAFYYSNFRMVPTVVGLDNQTVGVVEDYFLTKRLKKITHSQGSVEFIASTSERKDLAGNYPLDHILIKDIAGDTIKEYHFNYKYLTANDLVDDSPGLSVSKNNRLVMNSIEEVGRTGQAKPPHTFTYDINHYLPATDSYSKDHWGYYNGQNNARLQPKQLVSYWDPYKSGGAGWYTRLIGTANREPSTAHAQAGILKRVDYPTGGFTIFEYEGNTAIDDKLPALSESDGQVMDQPDVTYPIAVNLYSEDVQETVMTFRQIQPPPAGCTAIVTVFNTDTGQVEESRSFADGNPSAGDPLILEITNVFVPAGNYEVSFTLQGPNSICGPGTNNEGILINVLWEEESNSPTKNVGGVRIAKITDHAGAGVSHYRTFDYNGDDGQSSGSVVNVPKYWLENTFSAPGPHGNTVRSPLSLAVRTNTSQYPLVETAGNVVGYSKVTVTRDDGTQGKSEYYFTGPKDYNDRDFSFVQHDGFSGVLQVGPVSIETVPVPTENSREYLRGKLLKQVDYRYNGTGYDTIAKLENTYRLLSYDPNQGGQLPKVKSLIVGGVNIAGPQSGQTVDNIKEYEIHSGYMVPWTSKATQYTDNGNIDTETLNRNEEDSDTALLHMIPIETESTDSWGDKTLTKEYYAFNAKTSPDHIASQNAAIDMMVDQYNMVYQPVQTSVFRKKGSGNFEPLNTVQTRFQITGSNSVLPDKVYTRKENDNLQERLVYVDYDGRKNPLEIRRTDGPSTVFIWGYNGTQVIAKLENASYTGLTTGQTNAINDAVGASNLDVDSATEGTLRDELQDLREAFPNAMVTTFTYDVPIGVTSVTDPRGYTTHYGYDAQNRLETIADEQLRKLQDYLYHYKGQQ